LERKNLNNLAPKKWRNLEQQKNVSRKNVPTKKNRFYSKKRKKIKISKIGKETFLFEKMKIQNEQFIKNVFIRKNENSKLAVDKKRFLFL
jgi:hypothetical protein